jgi:hypothetical protein
VRHAHEAPAEEGGLCGRRRGGGRGDDGGRVVARAAAARDGLRARARVRMGAGGCRWLLLLLLLRVRRVDGQQSKVRRRVLQTNHDVSAAGLAPTRRATPTSLAALRSTLASTAPWRAAQRACAPSATSKMPAGSAERVCPIARSERRSAARSARSAAEWCIGDCGTARQWLGAL